MKTPDFSRLPLALGAFTSLAALAAAQPATGFNKTDTGPYDYNDAGNWAGGVINGVWDTTLVRTAAQTITFAGDTTLQTELLLNYSGNFSTTLRANGTGPFTLTLGGDITVNLPDGSGKTVTIGVSATPNQSLNLNLNGTRTLSVASGRTLTLANNVSGGGIIKTGSGNLYFSRPADYAGATLVKAGTLRFDTSTAAVANSDITAELGTLVQFGSSGSNVTRAKSITLNGTTLTGSGTSGGHSVDGITNALTIGSGASTVTLTPHGSYNERLAAGSFARTTGGSVLFRGTALGVNDIGTPTANSTNISFASSTGLLNQSGSGTTIGIIAGAYGDTTTAGGGFGATGGLVTYDAAKGVRLLNAATEYTAAIVSGQTDSRNVRYTAPATTLLTHATTAINSLSFDAAGAAGSQGITITGDTGTRLVINSGTIYVDFNSITGTPVAGDSVTISVPTLDLNAQDAAILISTGGSINQQNYPARLYINSEITNGSLGKSGPGQLQLGGATSNTYTGVTTLNAGSLSLAKTGGATAIAGDIVVNGGYLLQNDNQIADTSNVTVNGGQWRLATSTSGASPKNETISSLTVNGGTVYGGNGSAATATLTVTGAVAVTNTGAISSATGYNFNFGSLAVGNGGAVTLSAANNLTGGIMTVGGTLTITNTTGGAYTPISLSAGAAKGATLILGGDMTFNGNSTNTNTATINATAGTTLATINLNGGTRTFVINDGAAAVDLAIVASIQNGGLVKTGAGVLALSGASTYAGNTTVSAGGLTLAEGGSLTFYIGANGVTNSVGGSGNATFAGAFNFDLANASAVNGDSWTVVNTATLNESFTGTFAVNGFTNAGGGVWNSGDYSFNQSTGVLTYGAIPEPSSFAALAGAGLLAFAALRRKPRSA